MLISQLARSNSQKKYNRYDGAMNSAFREALVLCTDDEFRCKIYYLNALYCLNQFQGRQMALAAMESPDFEIKQEAKDIYMNITKNLCKTCFFTARYTIIQKIYICPWNKTTTWLL